MNMCGTVSDGGGNRVTQTGKVMVPICSARALASTLNREAIAACSQLRRAPSSVDTAPLPERYLASTTFPSRSTRTLTTITPVSRPRGALTFRACVLQG